MHEAANLTPSSTTIKHEWSYTSKPPYAFMECTEMTLPFIYAASLPLLTMCCTASSNTNVSASACLQFLLLSDDTKV